MDTVNANFQFHPESGSFTQFPLCFHAVGESQRDSVPKPRVARHELPWEDVERKSLPQRGCGQRHTTAKPKWNRRNRVAVSQNGFAGEGQAFALARRLNALMRIPQPAE